jgi:hypothetical protein
VNEFPMWAIVLGVIVASLVFLLLVDLWATWATNRQMASVDRMVAGIVDDLMAERELASGDPDKIRIAEQRAYQRARTQGEAWGRSFFW